MVKGSGTLTLHLLHVGQASQGTNWTHLELLLMRIVTLLIGNHIGHKLFKFNSDGKLVKSVGGEGGRTGQFDYPRGITHVVVELLSNIDMVMVHMDTHWVRQFTCSTAKHTSDMFHSVACYPDWVHRYSTHQEHSSPHLVWGALVKDNWHNHMGSPLTKMTSCMSVTSLVPRPETGRRKSHTLPFNPPTIPAGKPSLGTRAYGRRCTSVDQFCVRSTS